MRLLIVAIVLVGLAVAVDEAIEPGFRPLDASGRETREIPQQPVQAGPPPGFQLPGFGLKDVSHKPDGAGQTKPQGGGRKDEGGGKQVSATVGTAKPTTTTAVGQTNDDKKKKKEQEDKERKEREQKEKKEREVREKEKKEREQKEKREKEEAKKREQAAKPDTPKKDQSPPADKKPTSDNPGNKSKKDQPPNNIKKKRNPLPTKYQVPSNAGIAGVGGGALPDPGFVLEPGDLYERAENAAVGSSVVSAAGVWLAAAVVVCSLVQALH